MYMTIRNICFLGKDFCKEPDVEVLDIKLFTGIKEYRNLVVKDLTWNGYRRFQS